MTSQAIDQILTELMKSVEFVMKDDRSDVRLRIKPIGTITLENLVTGRTLSQDLNLQDH